MLEILKKPKHLGLKRMGGILAMVAAALIIPQVVLAAVNVSKTGTDTTTSSTTQTQPGNTVKWVMEYGHTGSLGTVRLDDAIPAGTQYVPSSFIAPPGFSTSFSVNGGSSYGSTDPGTAATNLRADGPAPPTVTSVASGLAQPPSSFNGAQGGGDGYEAFFWGDNLYNVNHHTTSSGLNATLLQCHNKNTGANCTSPVTFPTYASSVAGTPFGSGAVDVGTPTVSKGGEDLATGRVFVPANHVTGGIIDTSGVMCYDLANGTSCGYTALVNSPGASILSGGNLIGSRFYTVDHESNVYCMDINTFATCGAPYPIKSVPTFGTAFAVGLPDYGYQVNMESFDSRYLFTNLLASDGTTNSIGCVDVTTGALCPNFPQSYTATGPYNLIISPIKDTSGALLGACGSAAGSGQRFSCYRLDGASPGAEAPWPQQVPGQGIGWPNGQGYGSILSLGTKLYQTYVAAGADAGTYTCWDFATNSNCTTFTPSSSGAGIRPYSIRQDPFNPGCLWMVGDAGLFEVFDADTGSFTCSRSSAEVEAAPSSFYCDGQSGHVTNWTTLTINNITSADYSNGYVTLFDENDVPVAGFNNRPLTAAEISSGSVDISSVPISGDTEALRALITLIGVDGTAWTNDGNPNNDPFIQLSWQGDDIQFCFETTVLTCSGVETLTNSAAFLTTDASAPSGQTDTATATLANPGATCTPDVAVSKTVSSPTFNPGDTLTYTMTVTNNGTAAATNFTITDDLTQVLDDATYNNDAAVTGSGGGSTSYAAPTLTYTNASLPVGASATITYTVTAANPGTGNKNLTNTAVASTGNCVQGSTDPVCTAVSQGPNVSVQKSVNAPSGVGPGSTLTYSFVVTNNGPASANNLTITDNMTDVVDDATYNNDAVVSGTGGGSVSFASPNLTYTNASLAAGASATVTYTVTVNNPILGNRNLRNTLTSSQGNCVQGSTDPLCQTTTPVSDVAFVKTVSQTSANPGDTLTYTIVATNNGGAAANNISFTDDLSPLLDDGTYNNDAVVSGPGTVSFASPTLTYTVPTLNPAQSATITFTVTLNDPATGDTVLTNTVVSNQGNCMQGSSDLRCRAVTNESRIEIAKTADKTNAQPGETVNYTFTVSNTGTADAGNVNVVDNLSQILDDAAYNNDGAVTGPGITHTVSYVAPNLTYNVLVLAAGQTDTVTYSVTVNNPATGDGSLDNHLVSNQGNCQQGSTDPDCSTTATKPEVEIVKTVSSPTFIPGDTLTYTITVSNTGTGVAAVNLTDNLSGVLDDAIYNNDAAVTGTGGGTVSYAAPNLAYVNPAMAAGTSATITYTVTTEDPGTGDKTLQNSVTSNQGNCLEGSTDPRCRTTSSGPEIEVVKAASATTAHPGDTITYTLTVSNTGAGPASNVVVTDNLTQVLDDAVYNNNAVVTGPGSASYAAPNLTFTAPSLSPGQSSTITFTVTINNPATGDTILTNEVTSNQGNCQPGSTDLRCRTVTNSSRIETAKTADKTNVQPGETVAYTLTIRNTGTADAGNISVADNMTDVLDDAAYNNDAAVSGPGVGHSATFATPNLTYNALVLPAGATDTVTYSVTANNPVSGNNNLGNLLVANQGNCQAGSTDPDCVTDTTMPKMEIAKTVSSPTFNPGEDVTYTITVANTGSGPANFNLTDNLSQVLDDADFETVAVTGTAGGTATFATPNVTYTNAAMAAGTSDTITITVATHDPGFGDKALRNSVTTNQGNCLPGSTDPDCRTESLGPNITVQKTADAEIVDPGDTITYTMVISNTGPGPAQDVEVVDDLTNVLDDAAYNDDAAVTGSGSGSVGYATPVLTYSAATMAPGSSQTVTYTVTATQPAEGDQVLSNTAVSNQGHCQEGSENPACQAEVRETNVVVKKVSSDDEVIESDTVTYTVTVTNEGAAPASDVEITDDLTGVLDDAAYNDDAEITEGPGEVAYSEPLITYTTETLAVDEQAMFTYTVTALNPNFDGDRHMVNIIAGGNCVEPVTGGEPEEPVAPESAELLAEGVVADIPGCSTDTKVTPIPNLVVDKTPNPRTATPGRPVVYEIEYSNLSAPPDVPETSDATGVVLHETVPNNTVFRAEGSTPGWSCADGSPAGTECDLEIGSLPAGSQGTATFAVIVNDPLPEDVGFIGNTITMSDDCNNGCLPPGSKPQPFTQSMPVSRIKVSKTAPTTPLGKGEKLTYTVSVTNSGTGTFEGFKLEDDFSDVLDDANYNNDANPPKGQIAFAGNKLTWTADILAGETVTFTYSVTVKEPGSGNGRIINSLIDPLVASNCPAHSADPVCKVTTLVKAEMAKTGMSLNLWMIIGAVLSLGAALFGGALALRRIRG